MGCVTNIIKNKLSLFRTNSVKMFYIVFNRVHCHANAPSDYSVFIISNSFVCLSLFNFKLHTFHQW